MKSGAVWPLVVFAAAVSCQPRSVPSPASGEAGAVAPADSFHLASLPSPQHKVGAVLAAGAAGSAFVEIVGADFPDQVRVREPFVVRTYFRVLAPIAKDWELTMHIDTAKMRFNADHAPMAGAYPTSKWKTGELLVDAKEVRLDRAGSYVVHVTFTLGAERMKIKSGPSDADSRSPMGEIVVE